MPLRVLRLDDRDDVAVALVALQPDESISVADGLSVVVAEPIPIGHKIALREIVAGELVRKYGEPIGRATTQIRAGAHVHVHNLVSARLSDLG
jgi:altronate dehydratase